jgi:hypothetical protein
MKNLIFVALLVSVMLVLAVGTASAAFVAGEGDTRYDRAQEAGGPAVSSVEISSESGGSGGPIVNAGYEEIARFSSETLRFRLD